VSTVDGAEGPISREKQRLQEATVKERQTTLPLAVRAEQAGAEHKLIWSQEREGRITKYRGWRHMQRQRDKVGEGRAGNSEKGEHYGGREVGYGGEKYYGAIEAESRARKADFVQQLEKTENEKVTAELERKRLENKRVEWERTLSFYFKKEEPSTRMHIRRGRHLEAHVIGKLIYRSAQKSIQRSDRDS